MDSTHLSLNQQKHLHPVTIAVWEHLVIATHKDWTQLKEFKNKLYTNTKEIPGNGKDDDNNGYIDDVHGIAYNAKGSKDTSIIPFFNLAEKEVEEAWLFERG